MPSFNFQLQGSSKVLGSSQQVALFLKNIPKFDLHDAGGALVAGIVKNLQGFVQTLSCPGKISQALQYLADVSQFGSNDYFVVCLAIITKRLLIVISRFGELSLRQEHISNLVQRLPGIKLIANLAKNHQRFVGLLARSCQITFFLQKIGGPDQRHPRVLEIPAASKQNLGLIQCSAGAIALP